MQAILKCDGEIVSDLKDIEIKFENIEISKFSSKANKGLNCIDESKNLTKETTVPNKTALTQTLNKPIDDLLEFSKDGKENSKLLQYEEIVLEFFSLRPSVGISQSCVLLTFTIIGRKIKFCWFTLL